MKEGLEALTRMEYPGRFIVVGRSAVDDANFALYEITGRSPSSQARVLVESQKTRTIRTVVTNPEELKKGSVALLLYPAIAQHEGTIAVSNGAQTKLLYSTLRRYHEGSIFVHDSTRLLEQKSSIWEYDGQGDQWIDLTSCEPDAPNYTPRINAIVTPVLTIMQIRRCAEPEGKPNVFTYVFQLRNSPESQYYDLFAPGEGGLIATYSGENKNPLPSFKGRPKNVGFSWKTPQEAVDEVYDALAPKEGKPDFRVSVASMFVKGNKTIETAIRNRNALPESQ